MAHADKNSLDDDNRATGSVGMSPTLRGIIILVALLAVIAVSVAVTVAVLRGGDAGEGEVSGASTTALTSRESIPTSGEESSEEIPEVDSAALLEGAGVNVIMSGPVPEAVETWGDYRLERSTHERIRVFEGQGPSRATRDGSEWPMSMNSCGSAMYLVVFRSVNEDVTLNASLINSAQEIVASEKISQGWMLLTNCSTPQWEFLSSVGLSNLGDVVYDVHEYWESASAPSAGDGVDLGAESSETGMKHFYYCVADSPGQAVMTDGSIGYEPYCVEEPNATRSSLGEKCCGGLDGGQICGEELWFDLCKTRPPGW